MKQKTKCAIATCARQAVKDDMCTVHALCWLFTRDSRPGRDRCERLRQFVVRQDVRAALYHPPDTRPTCSEIGCEERGTESGPCAAHVADSLL